MTNHLSPITHNKNRNSFTLIELLVTLAIVAVLSVVVVVTLNPAELLKQARDSNRLSDLATINTALNLFSTDVIGGFMGTSTIVYTSLVNTINPATTTCAGMGLPALPTGWIYNCPTSTQSLRNTDGTGWIPVNFNRISSNSPMSQLPIDPTNTTSTRLYYTYTPGGSWELNATVEASKNKLGGSNDLVSKDGGSSPSTYELGSNLSLTPIETGDSSLVGYWNFEEGGGSVVFDRSGQGNTGTWNGTSTQRYVSGKVGTYAGTFNGTSDYIDVYKAPPQYLNFGTGPFSISLLFYPNSLTTPDAPELFVRYKTGGWNTAIRVGYSDQIQFTVNGSLSSSTINTANSSVATGRWYHLVAIYEPSGLTRQYIDGLINGTTANFDAGNTDASLQTLIGRGFNTWSWNGHIDDFRIYSRALSAAEVLAIYNATK